MTLNSKQIHMLKHLQSNIVCIYTHFTYRSRIYSRSPLQNILRSYTFKRMQWKIHYIKPSHKLKLPLTIVKVRSLLIIIWLATLTSTTAYFVVTLQTIAWVAEIQNAITVFCVQYVFYKEHVFPSLGVLLFMF